MSKFYFFQLTERAEDVTVTELNLVPQETLNLEQR